MFGKFGHLKDGSRSCLAQYDYQESVNIQSIWNEIHNMTFSRFAQDSGNVTSWRLGDIIKTSLGGLQRTLIFPAVSYRSCFGKKSFNRPQTFPVCSLMDVTFVRLSSSSF